MIALILLPLQDQGVHVWAYLRHHGGAASENRYRVKSNQLFEYLLDMSVAEAEMLEISLPCSRLSFYLTWHQMRDAGSAFVAATKSLRRMFRWMQVRSLGRSTPGDG